MEERRCRSCAGTGTADDKWDSTCRHCEGSGRVLVTDESADRLTRRLPSWMDPILPLALCALGFALVQATWGTPLVALVAGAPLVLGITALIVVFIPEGASAPNAALGAGAALAATICAVGLVLWSTGAI